MTIEQLIAAGKTDAEILAIGATPRPKDIDVVASTNAAGRGLAVQQGAGGHLRAVAHRQNEHLVVSGIIRTVAGQLIGSSMSSDMNQIVVPLFGLHKRNACFPQHLGAIGVDLHD